MTAGAATVGAAAALGSALAGAAVLGAAAAAGVAASAAAAGEGGELCGAANGSQQSVEVDRQFDLHAELLISMAEMACRTDRQTDTPQNRALPWC